MIDTIVNSFDIWTGAQGIKSRTRIKNVDNISLEGISKLRELILELAISGKLCETSLENPDFAKILKNIKNEREQFHKERNVRLQKFEPLQIKIKEFQYPKNWATVYFEDIIVYITDFQANGSFATLRKNVQYYDEENYAILVRLTDLRHNLKKSSGFVYTDEKGYNFLSKSIVNGGELVIANVGAGVGTILEIPVINKPATLAPNMFMLVLTKAYDKEFFKYFSKSHRYWEYINEVNVGTGQPKINKREYKSCKIPFPPLEEQHRIVAKVDELMALCDKLENEQFNNLKTHQVLVKTLLETLTQANDVDELHKAWERLSVHFDTLFCTDDSIDQLKQTILQLAVMGKLEKQDPKDEPASELLKKISKAKEKLIKEGKLKKTAPLSKIRPEEMPFNLPVGWEFCRLEELCMLITKGSSPKWQGVSYTENPNDVLFVTSENVGSYKLLLDSKKYVELKFNTIEPKSILKRGDFLMNIVGGSIGRTAIYNIDELANINQAVCLIRMLPEYIDERFFLHFFNSSICVSYMFDKQVDNARPNLSMSNISKFVIPLPSLTEQKRIVEKVESIFGLCDTIKEKILESQALKVLLSKTIVEKAVQ